jgi:anthranilate phosphoribosyltransferase
MAEFSALIRKVATGASLTREESTVAFGHMVTGAATPAQMGAFLMALRIRGETLDEIVGAVTTLRAKMVRVAVPADAVDVVGTGGDSSGSHNISTCAAFIAAGAGLVIAKHGNRAQSSRSGAADVLAALGVEIDITAQGVEHCVREAGIGFMFAVLHHPALKHVGPTRVELGTRTIFNLLGPMLNPAGVRRHMIGVFGREWVRPYAETLGELGSERAFVVHGADGLDELTTTGPTLVAVLEHGSVRTFEVTPEEVGLPKVGLDQLRGGDASTNAAALRAVLSGETGPYRDVATLNAAAALVVGQRAENLRDGLDLARKSIDSGEAMARLDRLITVSAAHRRDERTGA